MNKAGRYSVAGIAAAARPRPGATSVSSKESIPQTAAAVEQARLKGLELSEVLYKDPSFFRANPDNEIFNQEKDEQYFAALRRDIEEAGAILNPIITMPDGLGIEGHSRIRIALELAAEGKSLGKIPFRFILSDLKPEEIRRRVYLGNLSRFEISEDVRVLLYAKIWPGYYLAKTQRGRPDLNQASQDQSSQHIAGETKQSDQSVRNGKKQYQRALEIAKALGRDEPSPEDMAVAREEFAQIRRAKALTNKDFKSTQIRISRAFEKIEEMAERARAAASRGENEEANTARSAAFLEANGIFRAALAISKEKENG